MAKAIKWQIPFASLSGTLYRIDIYAEGYSGDPIQLTAGESPFVTEEDSSEDFFAPIRTQTGSIQVCTRKPDGTMLTLDEILPANNIDHPVRLINLSNSNAIEWQGFLSCEAYSQNYTSIPENLTLSVISVLEAMDSVEVKQTVLSGIMDIRDIVYQVLTLTNTEAGTSMWYRIFYSATDYRIFQKKLDTSVLFAEEKESNNNNETIIAKGNSCKRVLQKICTYMGWVCREERRHIYFERIGENIGMFRELLSDFGAGFHEHYATLSLTAADISGMTWRGDSHKRDLRQGARMVKVTANMASNDFQLKAPGCPIDDLEAEIHVSKYFNYTGEVRTPEMYTRFNLDLQAYPHLEYGFHTANLTWNANYILQSSSYAGTVSFTNAKQDTVVYGSHEGQGGAWASKRAGSFLVFHNSRATTTQRWDDKYVDGLYCSFYPIKDETEEDHPIFKMRTDKAYGFQPGRIKLSLRLARQFYMNDNVIQGVTDGNFTKYINFALSIGNKYYYLNPQTVKDDWDTNRHIQQLIMTGDSHDVYFEIDEYLSGQVKFELMAGVYGASGYYLWDVLFESIELSYEPYTEGVTNERSANNYCNLLSTNFRDEISVSTDFASAMNNKPSPSLIMNTDIEPMQMLTYSTNGGTESRRPEVDLLNRLASYYGASRQTIDLITKHPTAAVLPLLKLNGINDGKKYLPLSESRDWREETCTIKCFETI